MAKLLENGIYGIGTVRANRKQMPSLKQDKQMKRGEHDWQACQILSGWTTDLSSCYPTTMIQEL